MKTGPAWLACNVRQSLHGRSRAGETAVERALRLIIIIEHASPLLRQAHGMLACAMQACHRGRSWREK